VIEIYYCSECGVNLTRGKCLNSGHEPWIAPSRMGHLESSFLNAMKYDSTNKLDSYRYLFLDKCVHRAIKSGKNIPDEYIEQLGEMATSKRVRRMIVILEGLIGIKSAMGGNNHNRQVDVKYLEDEYLRYHNYKLRDSL